MYIHGFYLLLINWSESPDQTTVHYEDETSATN